MEVGSLSAQATGGRGRRLLEVSAQGRSEEVAEDEVGTLEDGQREPQQENELEGEIEGKPVNDVHKGLNDSKEGEHNPVCQPLRIIMLGSGEEGLEGVVAGNHKTSDVGQKLTAKVEDDEEEIKQDSAENSIGLGNTALSLEVDESRVPAQLVVKLADIVLNLFLRGRHRFGITEID